MRHHSKAWLVENLHSCFSDTLPTWTLIYHYLPRRSFINIYVAYFPYNKFHQHRQGYRGSKGSSNPKRTSKASNTKTGEPRPASTGHFTITPSCLVSDHGQPMGFAMYSVISFGIWGCVATRQLAVQPSSSYPGTVTDFRPRDSKSSPKERNRKHSQHERFFSSMFTVPKKGGGWRLIINLKSLNSYLVPGGLSFQNGGHRKPERCVAGRWLHGKDQSRGCLPFSASSSGTSRFLKFCCRQKKCTGLDPSHSAWIQHQESSWKFCGPS